MRVLTLDFLTLWMDRNTTQMILDKGLRERQENEVYNGIS